VALRVTRVRAIVADRSRETRIAAGGTVVHRIAELAPGAEKPVIGAVGIVRVVHTPVADFVACIHRAVDPVAAIDRRSCLATIQRVARLHPVAEFNIVAERVVRVVHTLVADFVACIHRAVDPIVAVDRRSRLAGSGPVASFFAVAEFRIRTGAPRRLELAAGTAAVSVERIAVVAILTGVQNPVPAGGHGVARAPVFVADRSGETRIAAGGAVVHRIAELAPGAEKPVIGAVGVVRVVHTPVVDFVACIHRAVDPVAAVDRRSRLAGSGAVASLFPVAELPIRAGAPHRLELALRTAAVPGRGVAVIAVFSRLDDSVAAHGLPRAVGVGLVVEKVAIVIEPRRSAVHVLASSPWVAWIRGLVGMGRVRSEVIGRRDILAYRGVIRRVGIGMATDARGNAGVLVVLAQTRAPTPGYAVMARVLIPPMAADTGQGLKTDSATGLV
jgi:hypothetical protein